MNTTATREPFWACVEVQGRQTHYGRATEVMLCGRLLLRVDVYLPGGADPIMQPEIAPEMFYRVTPCSEDVARKGAAEQLRWSTPHVPLALPAAPTPITTERDPERFAELETEFNALITAVDDFISVNEEKAPAIDWEPLLTARENAHDVLNADGRDPEKHEPPPGFFGEFDEP